MTVEELLHRVNTGQIVTFYKTNEFGSNNFVIEIRNCSGSKVETLIRDEVPSDLLRDVDRATTILESKLTGLAINDQIHNQKHNE